MSANELPLPQKTLPDLKSPVLWQKSKQKNTFRAHTSENTYSRLGNKPDWANSTGQRPDNFMVKLLDNQKVTFTSYLKTTLCPQNSIKIIQKIISKKINFGSSCMNNCFYKGTFVKIYLILAWVGFGSFLGGCILIVLSFLDGSQHGTGILGSNSDLIDLDTPSPTQSTVEQKFPNKTYLFAGLSLIFLSLSAYFYQSHLHTRLRKKLRLALKYQQNQEKCLNSDAFIGLCCKTMSFLQMEDEVGRWNEVGKSDLQ